jgi:hypothetical protein
MDGRHKGGHDGFCYFNSSILIATLKKRTAELPACSRGRDAACARIGFTDSAPVFQP